MNIIHSSDRGIASARFARRGGCVIQRGDGSAIEFCSVPAVLKRNEMMADLLTEGTNRAFSYEVTTTASPEDVWALWTDVSTWKAWDKGLKDAKLGEPMTSGSKGRLLPRAGPSSSFLITEFNSNISYTFVTNLPLAKLSVKRTIISTSPTRFRHAVSFSGLLGAIFAQLLGPEFRRALPPTMLEIKALAERNG